MVRRAWFAGSIAAVVLAGVALAADPSTITIALTSETPISDEVFYKAYAVTDPDSPVEIGFGKAPVTDGTVTLTLTIEHDGPVEIWIYGTNVVETRMTAEGCVENLFPGARVHFDTLPVDAQVTATTEPFVISGICGAATVTPPPTDVAPLPSGRGSGRSLWFAVALIVATSIVVGQATRKRRMA
jgi:hypothetical protein